ncbi:MAG: hypothetical protein AAGE84_01600 [Cyanobacteria bacterium P01_G01_bin.39]
MNKKHFFISVITVFCTLFAVKQEKSWSGIDKAQLLSKLQSGGYVIYFRHAENATDPSLSFRLPEQFEDCLVKDNLLTETGVDHIRSVGTQFKESNIPVGEVISSPICRCMESAWFFGFGKVAADSSLNGVYEEDNKGNFIVNEAVEKELAIDLRRLLVKKPEQGGNTVLFAHSSNIGSLTGFKLEKGEAAIFKPNGQGGFQYIDRMLQDEWQSLINEQ